MPQILMPALSPTMEEGKLSKWLVKVGDSVKSGDVLAEIETDKATMEVESVDEGVVKELLVAEGTEGVKVNTPIALVLAEGETASAAPVAQTAPEPSEAPVVAAEKAADAAPSTAAVPAAPKFEAQSDPDLPEGVEMVEMTVRQALNEAMLSIERANAHRQNNFDGILTGKIDFNKQDELPRDKLVNLINHFSSQTFDRAHVSDDLFGNAYEYLIRNFASKAGKSSGEFYTPAEVGFLMAEVLQPRASPCSPHSPARASSPCPRRSATG